MLISELDFPHLREARDERLAAALERRRLVAERLAEQATSSPAAAATRGRMPRTRRRATAASTASAVTTGTAGAAEPCSA